MRQKRCCVIFKAMTEEIYSFNLLLLEFRCFAVWSSSKPHWVVIWRNTNGSYPKAPTEPPATSEQQPASHMSNATWMFHLQETLQMTGAQLVTSWSRKIAQLSSTYRLMRGNSWLFCFKPLSFRVVCYTAADNQSGAWDFNAHVTTEYIILGPHNAERRCWN